MTQLAAPSLTNLPESFYCRPTQLSAIRVTGEDREKYLQGQLTCDLHQVKDTNVLMGGQCNPTGKLLSIFRLIRENEGYLLIQPQTSIDAALPELKKYGVFSKVDIAQVDDLNFTLLVGEKAQAVIKEATGSLPDSLTQVVDFEGAKVIALGGDSPRYLAIGDETSLNKLISDINAPELAASVWDLLEITNGIASIPQAVAGEYVPQMVNLQHLHGISFTKGCYLGQETVARMQYLGKNKRALYVLSGEGFQGEQPTTVEVQLGENWRRGGLLVNTYLSDDKTFYASAILNSDTEQTAVLRLKEAPDVTLTIQPLPYSLAEAQ